MAFFRFRRSIGILPGLRINIGKRGASLSVGVRGAHMTFGKTGTRTTVGIPGTGLSYTDVVPHHHQHGESAPVASEDVAPGASVPTTSSSRAGLWASLLLLVVIALVVASLH